MRIKEKIFPIALLFSMFAFQTHYLRGQSDFEKQLSTIALNLAEKIVTSGKTKIAVSDFLDNDGKQTKLGQAIAEELSVNLIDAGKGLQVMERNQLKSILKEHQLTSTGLIDPETAKHLGKLKMVDAVLVGTITPLGDLFRLSVKVLDTETGLGIAASKGEIARTEALNKLFGNETQTISGSVLSSSSPSTSTASQQTSTEAKIPNCEEKKIGNFCFMNTKIKTTFTVAVYYKEGSDVHKTITVQPGQTQCIYEFPFGPHNYEIVYKKIETIGGTAIPGGPAYEVTATYAQGQIYVEQCKTKTFEIK